MKKEQSDLTSDSDPFAVRPLSTGEMLPHPGGETMLNLLDLEPIRAGYSSLCTHAFVTSAAIAQAVVQVSLLSNISSQRMLLPR
jgi:hypothetical protein